MVGSAPLGCRGARAVNAPGEGRRIIVDSLFDDPPVLLEIDAAGAGHVAQVMEDDYERTGNAVSLQVAQVIRAGL